MGSEKCNTVHTYIWTDEGRGGGGGGGETQPNILHILYTKNSAKPSTDSQFCLFHDFHLYFLLLMILLIKKKDCGKN